MFPYFFTPGVSLFHGDVREVCGRLPKKSAHCIVTSPPYYGLRDYGVEGQLGSEKTPEEYLDNMVAVFMAAAEVLRDDGTIWLNIGDSYNHDAKWGGRSGGVNEEEKGYPRRRVRGNSGCKPKELLGIPWRLALALSDAGLYLRGEVIWHKRSPMPESVGDRPTRAHEQIFLFSKQPKYFYDDFASSEEVTGGAHSRGAGGNPKAMSVPYGDGKGGTKANEKFSQAVVDLVERRNMRTVWSLSSYSFKGAHFATFPPELVRRCLSAGVSEAGCCSECGAPYKRIIHKERKPTRPGCNSKATSASQNEDSPYHDTRGTIIGNRDPRRHTTVKECVGWSTTCKHAISRPNPCIVFDPFHGAGTTMMVANRLKLNYFGIDISQKYLDLSIERLRAGPIAFPSDKDAKKKRTKKSKRQRELFDGI